MAKVDPQKAHRDAVDRFTELVKQWYDPAGTPEVEWSQVEKARREAVMAGKHCPPPEQPAE